MCSSDLPSDWDVLPASSPACRWRRRGALHRLGGVLNGIDPPPGLGMLAVARLAIAIEGHHQWWVSEDRVPMPAQVALLATVTARGRRLPCLQHAGEPVLSVTPDEALGQSRHTGSHGKRVGRSGRGVQRLADELLGGRGHHPPPCCCSCSTKS